MDMEVISMLLAEKWKDYELLDASLGQKLE